MQPHLSAGHIRFVQHNLLSARPNKVHTQAQPAPYDQCAQISNHHTCGHPWSQASLAAARLRLFFDSEDGPQAAVDAEVLPERWWQVPLQTTNQQLSKTFTAVHHHGGGILRHGAATAYTNRAVGRGRGQSKQHRAAVGMTRGGRW
jgi:hypothetical protein